jgi:mRNA interferase HicA
VTIERKPLNLGYIEEWTDYTEDGGEVVKKVDLEKKLHKLGWHLKRHGGSHDVWTNGILTEYVPRHTEIAEGTAKKILRKAQQNLEEKEVD